MKNNHGFITITEIMILVAICGILVAIAVPAFSAAKERTEHPNRFKSDGTRITVSNKKTSDVEEVDTQKIIYNGHTFIKFNYGSSAWGVHDPDCLRCAK